MRKNIMEGWNQVFVEMSKGLDGDTMQSLDFLYKVLKRDPGSHEPECRDEGYFYGEIGREDLEIRCCWKSIGLLL
jgi:hypothetical protein